MSPPSPGGTQTLPGGLVASQEAIKELGTNGGGYLNANSAHPFENPTAFTNLFEIFLLLVDPVLAAPHLRYDGRQRQAGATRSWPRWWCCGPARWSSAIAVENAHPGVALQAAGAATEGKEVRFGIPLSAMFAVSTTMTSTGAIDSTHSSYTGLGGGVLLLDMLLGEISPGGTGSGSVRHADPGDHHRVRRRPDGRPHADLPGQADRRHRDEVRRQLPAGHPGGGAARAPRPRWRCRPGQAGPLNSGPHALTEIAYAFGSAANNNGSAFAGLSANTDFYNIALGIAMLIGRLLPIALVLGLAGSLARQGVRPDDAGTLPTYRPQFVVMLVGVVDPGRRPDLPAGARARPPRRRTDLTEHPRADTPAVTSPAPPGIPGRPHRRRRVQPGEPVEGAAHRAARTWTRG